MCPDTGDTLPILEAAEKHVMCQASAGKPLAKLGTIISFLARWS